MDGCGCVCMCASLSLLSFFFCVCVSWSHTCTQVFSLPCFLEAGVSEVVTQVLDGQVAATRSLAGIFVVDTDDDALGSLGDADASLGLNNGYTTANMKVSKKKSRSRTFLP